MFESRNEAHACEARGLSLGLSPLFFPRALSKSVVFIIMPYKQLSDGTKKMFKLEIEQIETRILEKKHEIFKCESTRENIQKALEYAIAQQKHAVLAAQERIAELVFDFENNVTFNSLGSKISEARQEIIRLQGNLRVRQDQIQRGIIESPDRNESAGNKFKDKLNVEIVEDVEHDRQSKIEEVGQQENIDAEA